MMMTPEQALNILAQMVVQTHATLADHQAAQQALSVIQNAISSEQSNGPEEG